MESLPTGSSGIVALKGSRGLSRRRTRNLVRIGQRWQDGERTWIVRNIHRKDGLVSLERADGRGVAFVSFGELGKRYRLSDQMPRGP